MSVELTSVLANKDVAMGVVAAAAVAASVALWRALQKERSDRIADLQRDHDKDMQYLLTLRDLKEVISGLRTEFAAWRDSDKRRRED